MNSPDELMASAGAALARRRGDQAAPPAAQARERMRRRQRAKRQATAIGIVNALILVVAIAVGLVLPLGMFGALGVLALMIAATVAIASLPDRGARAPVAEALRTADLHALPAQTERWLAAQRPALPAPAATLADSIGLRLETLAPQLAALEPNAPAAEEARKLMAEQLPEFVRGYQRVPEPLRRVERGGRTPDAQLADGLAVIDRQLAQLSESLAQGDLDALSTRGRYLEIRYEGDAPA